MKNRARFGDRCDATVTRNAGRIDGVKLGGRFIVTCFDKDGKEKWRDTIQNLVVTQGLQHILDTEFTGSAQVTVWYLGLTDGTPTVAAGDTLASHAGWVEVTDYTGTRQAWVETRTGQTLSNSGSKAVFSITGTATVGGAFMCSVTSGTSGTLMCGGAFTTGDKSVINGDTLNVQYDFSAADDGV